MTKRLFLRAVVACAAVLAAAAAPAQSVEELQQAQRAAMAPLATLDGTWRGPAKVMLPDGRWQDLVQTERVGSMLNGTVKVIEGRGYMPDGTLHFNAFAIVSYRPESRAYGFHSYALGREGDFRFELRDGGFSWSIPAGPATIRYTATVRGDTWTEIGERLVEGQPPMRIYEMTLRKVGTTDWPVQGFVPAR